jgi:glutamate racemase
MIAMLDQDRTRPPPAVRPSRRPRVTVFDSGVGGLSVLREIADLLPEVELAFVGDNGNFPYGTKPADQLLDLIESSVRRAVAATRPDILVIACNTASTLALPRLRGFVTVPVVGVVPAIKPAARHSRSKVIGLLATPATVARPYTQALIDEFAADCTVLRVGSAALVELAERRLRGETVDRAELTDILAPFFAGDAGARLDTIVLACTHFPLLRDDLAAAAPRRVIWLDSGAAIARRVASLLADRRPPRLAAHPVHGAWFTAPAPDLDRLTPALARLGIGPAEVVG